MKKMSKLLALMLIMAMVLTSFVGCGDKDEDSNDDSNNDSANDSSNDDSSDSDDSSEAKSGKIVINVHNYLNNEAFVTGIDEIKKMDKYKNVEFVVADKDEEYETTLPIKIAGGEQVDICATFNPIITAKFATADIIQPIDEFIEAAGVDYATEFGPYAETAKVNGQTYLVPQNATKWVLYYNKKIFDDAGIAYPDADIPMTWDEYRELAAELTSGEGSDKIYGALHLDWPMFWYGEAIMKLGGGEHFYTADGLSNIEDPAFIDALEDTYAMMHEEESIPTLSDIKTSKASPQVFFNGKYGMFAQGQWMLNWLMDKETYPRDWEVGMCPLPVDAGETMKTWGVCGGLCIAKTSADPQLAFEVAMDLQTYVAQYATTETAAIQTVEQPNLFVTSGEALASEGMDTDVIKKYFNAKDQIFITEKVTGANNSKYEEVINEEVEKYLVQEQDIDTTIANIKERGDKVITEE